MLIADINLNDFRSFRKQQPFFMWYEERKKFVLLKPFNGVLFRCIVVKTDLYQDNIFKETELVSLGGFRIEKLQFVENISARPVE